jgi:glycosyltransferase involved in cell wall biosynthesis
VRSIAANARPTAIFDECILAALAHGKMFRITNLLPTEDAGVSLIARSFAWTQRAKAAATRQLDEQNPAKGVKTGLGRKTFLLFCSVCADVYVAILRLVGVDPYTNRAVNFEPRNDDCLVLLDSSWHDQSLFSVVAELKHRGVRIVAVVYDTIPIRHRRFCEPNLVDVFDNWFNQMIEMADAFVCISRWVSKEVQDEVQNRIGHQKMREKAYSWFHLGSELDQKSAQQVLSNEIKLCFNKSVTTFIVVGTIEPRKNHALIMEAFEKHWANGGQSRLSVIGRVGWMCDDVVSRLKSHPENGRRLFWFNNAGDDELEFAYQNADALIFSSFVEGFGLPLVEGLQRGLPAIASDIPVFREVAGDFAEYFDPNNASDLCAIIDQFSLTKKLPNARPVNEWKWITWKESAQQLFGAVDQCCRELDERRSPSNAHQH